MAAATTTTRSFSFAPVGGVGGSRTERIGGDERTSEPSRSLVGFLDLGSGPENREILFESLSERPRVPGSGPDARIGSYDGP
jgi:hypothetical protein